MKLISKRSDHTTAERQRPQPWTQDDRNKLFQWSISPTLRTEIMLGGEPMVEGILSFSECPKSYHKQGKHKAIWKCFFSENVSKGDIFQAYDLLFSGRCLFGVPHSGRLLNWVLVCHIISSIVAWVSATLKLRSKGMSLVGCQHIHHRRKFWLRHQDKPWFTLMLRLHAPYTGVSTPPSPETPRKSQKGVPGPPGSECQKSVEKVPEH